MTEKKRNPEAYLPLTPAMFHVLLALADGDRHGYAIMKEVEARSGGEVTLSAGTLYGIIKRLLAEEMIEETRRRSAFEDARRRNYRLSRFGRQVALAEAERMEKVIAMARDKNILRGTQPA